MQPDIPDFDVNCPLCSFACASSCTMEGYPVDCLDCTHFADKLCETVTGGLCENFHCSAGHMFHEHLTGKNNAGRPLLDSPYPKVLPAPTNKGV